MTIQIKRRYNFDEWEPIAEYRDGEFTGDSDFLEFFGHMEGQNEEEILNRFDGPNLLAMRSEGDDKMGKEWVEDPSEQAESTRWRNTETGEYRYQESKPGGSAGSAGSGSGEDSESGTGGGYSVDTEFGNRVASAVSKGEVVGNIAANEWMSNAGQIEDEDLLIDALEQVEEDGTKTSRERIRRRLRGLGWEDSEIDQALTSGEGGDGGDDGDLSIDDLEVGHTIILDFGEGGEPAEIVDIDMDSSFPVDVRYEDGTVQSLDEYDIDYAARSLERRVGFAEQVEELSLSTGTTGVKEPWIELAERTSTEELEEFIEAKYSVDDPYLTIEDYAFTEIDENDPSNLEYGEKEIMDTLNAYAAEEITTEEANNRAQQIIREYGEELGMFSESIEDRFAKALLTYRSDTTHVYDVRDFIPFEGSIHSMKAKEVSNGIREAMKKMEPGLGAYAAATIMDIEFTPISGSGSHSSNGKIKIDPLLSNPKRTASHEFGHQVHEVLNLTKDHGSYPDSDEWREFGREDAVWGLTERDMDQHRDLRKVEKSWERYQDGDVEEIRTYQRRHSVEYLAISFAHWATDESKLLLRDPYIRQFWEVYAGGAERVEPDAMEDLQEGDELIVREGDDYRLVEFGGAYDDGTKDFAGYPKDVGGKSATSVPYSWDEVDTEEVIRHG